MRHTVPGPRSSAIDDIPDGLPSRPERSGGAPLDALAHLTGTWAGSGLHVGYRFVHDGEDPGDAAACATRETISFAQIVIPAEGAQGAGAPLPGVYFLRRSNDALTGAPVQAESGTWLTVAERPACTEVLCLTTSARGPSAALIGTARALAGAPDPRPLDTAPSGQTTGLPLLLQRRLESLAQMPAPRGVSRAALAAPHLLLSRADTAARSVEETLRMSVASAGADAAARAVGLAGPAGDRDGLACAAIELCLQRTGTRRGGYERLLISRTVRRRAGGVLWPLVSVATLERSGAPGA